MPKSPRVGSTLTVSRATDRAATLLLPRRDPEPFDWYQRYTELRDVMSQYLRKSSNLLMSGCGNSRWVCCFAAASPCLALDASRSLTSCPRVQRPAPPAG